MISNSIFICMIIFVFKLKYYYISYLPHKLQGYQTHELETSHFYFFFHYSMQMPTEYKVALCSIATPIFSHQKYRQVELPCCFYRQGLVCQVGETQQNKHGFCLRARISKVHFIPVSFLYYSKESRQTMLFNYYNIRRIIAQCLLEMIRLLQRNRGKSNCKRKYK